MTVRHNRRPNASAPYALAARLPDDLRSFKLSTDPDDLRSHITAVADWLNTQIPGTAEHLTSPVMSAAGLSAVDWYRQALDTPVELRPVRIRPSRPPAPHVMRSSDRVRVSGPWASVRLHFLRTAVTCDAVELGHALRRWEVLQCLMMSMATHHFLTTSHS